MIPILLVVTGGSTAEASTAHGIEEILVGLATRARSGSIDLHCVRITSGGGSGSGSVLGQGGAGRVGVHVPHDELVLDGLSDEFLQVGGFLDEVAEGEPEKVFLGELPLEASHSVRIR
jgi:hypothetical protein